MKMCIRDRPSPARATKIVKATASAIEAQVSTVQYSEATDTEPARYEALLMESGLFVMTLQLSLIHI